ncbi:endonuclease/exonuclease/phosphatase family protein [Pseudoalteromonas sp. S16_S37]|uniref:endonuclease/exonuclease/phosphatase family protein n=1 Tax=Pseudoalteromonas sp. S16_S37 TaxID=2720228 RepID=UPI0016815E34|nr:endonuclease/exonuclease/phosphatase family protein [Pseudoalteromonas sp. S16_S37]MBD1583452.1 endonuclease [Pseudoalteromonas sp. S16_S37]
MKKPLSVSFAAALTLSGLTHAISAHAQPLVFDTQVKVVTANLWHDLSAKAHYYEAGVAEFKHLDADIIFTQEADGASARLANDLDMYLWQGSYAASSMGILSKFPIKQVIDTDTTGSHIGAVLDINGRDVVVWSNHWNYKQYVSYDARGGNGTTWAARKHCQAVSDSNELDALNDQSQRPIQAASLLQSLKPFIEQGIPVIAGGDTNEPSGLDWRANTANMFDHKGTVYDFKSHRIVRAGGLTDSYRKLYPNPVTHPGISWPFRQEDSWTKGSTYIKECGRALDDRDRIDFIYYNQQADGVSLQSAAFVGPRFNTYFSGPDGQDAQHNWQDPYVGRLVNSETQTHEYGIYDFPSDHLWYQTSFIIKTPSDKSTSVSLDNNAKFDNVLLSAAGTDLQVTFTLSNSQYLGKDSNYLVNVSSKNAGPADQSGGSVSISSNQFEQQISLLIPKRFLTSQLAQNDIQLRLFHHNGASLRVDAVYDLSWAAIGAVIDLGATTNTTISASKTVYGVNEPIVANFSNAPGNAKDWIGIYHKGSPSDGSVYSIDWQYINGQTSGSRTFAGLAAGEYLLRVFADNGYTLLAQTSFVVQ